MAAFTQGILEYTDPHPFVLPGDMTTTTGAGPFSTTKISRQFILPFDGRYLEEIMYNINRARESVFNKSPIKMNAYDQRGNVTESFYPRQGYSYLNNRVSIVAFTYIVEDIKAAIEDTIDEPDSLKAHFGRCFNLAHYKGFPFVSRGLLARMPDFKTTLEEKGEVFYTFPEDLDGPAMHGIFHRFEYNLPHADNPARSTLVDAFRKARSVITDGIPLFTRMQNGEWPVTRQELLTILGMSIYSKHGDIAKRPKVRSGYTSEADKYHIDDHRRVFYSMCSFVIQMLRYQVPQMERFQRSYSGMDNQWWTSRWFLWRHPCGYFWELQGISQMLQFDSGLWHFCGHGEFEGDGAYLDVPRPGYATSINWFSEVELIDRGIGASLPYGFAPMTVEEQYAAQDSRYNGFWTFHKFMTFEMATNKSVGEFTEQGEGIMTRVVTDPSAERYCRSGGDIGFISPWKQEPGVVVFQGAPISKVNIYDKFVENNTANNILDNYHNAITNITILLQNWTSYPETREFCNSARGNSSGRTDIKIEYVGFLDDMIHKPEEFLD
jgi:hypothetical protein